MQLPLVVDRLRRLSRRREARVAVVMWLGAFVAIGAVAIHPLPGGAARFVVGLLIVALLVVPGPLLGIAAMRVERSLAAGTVPGSRPASGYLGQVAVAVVTATVAVFGLILVAAAVVDVAEGGVFPTLAGCLIAALVAAAVAPWPAVVGVALAARAPRQMLLGRLVRLCRRREVQAIALVWVVVSVIACFFHATGRIAYPSALLANVLVGLLGPWIGVAAARVEQDLVNAREVPGLPPALRAAKGPLRSALIPALIASGVVLDLVLVTWGAALAVGHTWPRDGFANGTFLYIVMVLGSVPVAATLGVIIGALSRRRLIAAIAVCGVIAGSVAWTLWPFLTGPQLGLFNHFLGYLPVGGRAGELISLDAVFFYRGVTLAWAGLGVAFLGLTVDDRFRLAQPVASWRRLPAGVLVLAMLVPLVGLELRGSSFGFDASAREAALQLGPTVRTAHFVIHFPKDVSQREMERLVAIHERAYEKVIAYLHLPDGTAAPITSWLVSSPEVLGERGWGGFAFAKPWRREIVLDTGWPSGDRDAQETVRLGREVAYVILGDIGRGPLRVSTSDGLLPNRGFETGLAIAATEAWDFPDAWTMHADRRAEALRATGLARDPRGQFTSLGVFSGRWNDDNLDASFISWLVATHGVRAVEGAFHAGDLRLLGDPKALFRSWGAALDRTPATIAERRGVKRDALRGARGWEGADCKDDPHRALYLETTLRCARRAIAAGHSGVAVSWLRQSLVVEPELPALRVMHVRAALDQGRPKVALARLVALVEDPKVDPQHFAGVLEAEGDRLWRAGKIGDALGDYTLALRADPCDAEDDTELRYAALLTPELASRPDLVLGSAGGEKAVARAQAALDAAPDSTVAEYLLGDSLLEADQDTRALPQLERALALDAPPLPGLQAMVLTDLAKVRWDTGDDTGAVAAEGEKVSLGVDCCLQARYDRWKLERDRFIVAWRASHPHWKPDVITSQGP